MEISQEFLIAAFIGLVAVPLIDFIKAKFWWEGGKALVLSIAVSAVGGLAVYGVGILFGLYTIPEISWETLPGLFAVVFAIAQAVYQGIKIRREG